MRVTVCSRSFSAFVFLSIVAVSHATVFWMPVWKETTVLRYHPKKGWYPVKHGGTGSTFLKPKKLPPLGHVLKNILNHNKKAPPRPPPISPLVNHHKKYRGWRKKPIKPIVQLPLPHSDPPLSFPHSPPSWKKPSKPTRPPFLKSFVPSKLKPKPKRPKPKPLSKPTIHHNFLPIPSLFPEGPFPPTDFLPKPSPPKRKRRPKISTAYNPFHRIIRNHFAPHSPFKIPKKPIKPESAPYIKLNSKPFEDFPNHQQFLSVSVNRRPKKIPKRVHPKRFPKRFRAPKKIPKKVNTYFEGGNIREAPKPIILKEPQFDAPGPLDNPFFSNPFSNKPPILPLNDDSKEHGPPEEPIISSFFSNDFNPPKLKPMFGSDNFDDIFDFPKEPPRALKVSEPPRSLHSNSYESSSSEEYYSNRPRRQRHQSPRVPRVKTYPPVYPKFTRFGDDDRIPVLDHPPPPPPTPPPSHPPKLSHHHHHHHDDDEDYDDSPRTHSSSFRFNGFPAQDYSPKLYNRFTPKNNFYNTGDFPKTDHLRNLGEQHLPIPKEFANFAFGHGFTTGSEFAQGRRGQGWGPWVW